MAERLQLVVRTPHDTVLDERVDAVRVPTPTGLAGLRPGQEPLMVVVEAGLIVARSGDVERFVATAGGLLDADRRQVVVLSPFAAAGSEREVLAALDRVLATPNSELEVRRRLGELEKRIVSEIRQRPAVARARSAT